MLRCSSSLPEQTGSVGHLSNPFAPEGLIVLPAVNRAGDRDSGGQVAEAVRVEFFPCCDIGKGRILVHVLHCVSACNFGSGAKLMNRTAQITQRQEDGL